MSALKEELRRERIARALDKLSKTIGLQPTAYDDVVNRIISDGVATIDESKPGFPLVFNGAWPSLEFYLDHKREAAPHLFTAHPTDLDSTGDRQPPPGLNMWGPEQKLMWANGELEQ